MSVKNHKAVSFLRWALPELGYVWDGFRKPRGQVIKRISNRIAELEIRSFDDYRQYLNDHPEEWNQLDHLLDVTISKFFRDRKLWEYLQADLIPVLLEKRLPDPLRIWSVGCCNGEEPYSIAILIRELEKQSGERNIQKNGPAEISDTNSVRILASDRNKEVIKRAAAGRYPTGSLKEVPDHLVKNYFLPIEDTEEDYKIDESIKQMVQFEKRDIRKSLPDEPFDLVFCRNLVFTYFSIDHRLDFLNRLKLILSPGGFLVIGANESLPDTDNYQSYNRTHPVYMRIDRERM